MCDVHVGGYLAASWHAHTEAEGGFEPREQCFGCGKPIDAEPVTCGVAYCDNTYHDKLCAPYRCDHCSVPLCSVHEMQFLGRSYCPVCVLDVRQIAIEDAVKAFLKAALAYEFRGAA